MTILRQRSVMLAVAGRERLRLLLQLVRRQEEAIKTQWAQVENQLQRRNDLIPNLVETIKGVAQQEKRRLRPDRRVARQAGRRADARADASQAANEQSARAGAAAGDRRELSAAAFERDVQPADGRARGHREPHRRRARCATTSACRNTTRCGGSSRPTSPPASSASRSIPLLQCAAGGGARADASNFGRGRDSQSIAKQEHPWRWSMRCCPSSITR